MKKIQKLFKTGDNLELHIDGLGKGKIALQSSLEEFVDNNKLVITTKFSGDLDLDLIDSNPNILLTSAKGAAGLLKVNGIIKEFSQNEENFTLVIELGNDFEQTQRREFYRLSVLKDVQLGLQGDGLHDGFTQNISAGGLKCILPIRIRAGAQINVKLELDSEIFEVTGRVLDSMIFNEESQTYVLRIEFIDTTEKVRSKLISYIFHEQSRHKKIQKN